MMGSVNGETIAIWVYFVGVGLMFGAASGIVNGIAFGIAEGVRWIGIQANGLPPLYDGRRIDRVAAEIADTRDYGMTTPDEQEGLRAKAKADARDAIRLYLSQWSSRT